MYTIRFEGMSFASVSDIETACALALSVHRSSNIAHVVDVLDPTGTIFLTFSFTPKKNK